MFGCFLPPLVYALLRQFRVTRAGAIVGGCLVNFDMLNLMESRLILTDSQLMFYSALSLYVALRFWRRLNEFTPAAPAGPGRLRQLASATMSVAEENKWCLALGLACGAALR